MTRSNWWGPSWPLRSSCTYWGSNMACERCLQLRALAKEQARKLQLKRLAQTAAEAARVALSKKDGGDAK